MNHLIFCYGSLKRGFHNNSFLINSEYIGSGTTEPMYEMSSRLFFPVVSDGNNSIYGEVFSIDDTTLQMIDELEMNGVYYIRKLTTISLVNGSRVEAWIYVALDPNLITDRRNEIEFVGDSLCWVGPYAKLNKK